MKKFLRPTRLKIVLAVVFFVVFLFFPIVPCVTGGMIDLEEELNSHWSFCSALINPFAQMGTFEIAFGINFLGDDILVFLYITVVSYILASTISYFFKSE